MSLLVVTAHFDVARTLRRHTRRALAAYAADADRVVTVSTSGLNEQSLERLPPGVEFHTRDNFGYDFYSYKWALDLVGDYQDYDQILIVNDSFVGPTLRVRRIVTSRAAQRADLMGMTLSHNHHDHVQSFFMLANSYVVRSNAFRRFWADMEPISDRTKVIHRYEVGFSRVIQEAGFTLGSFFRPTDREVQLAAQRYRWHKEHRYDWENPGRTVAQTREVNLAGQPWNPGLAYADRVLLGDRLPLLKIDALRFDPYALGADRLLTACETQKPAAFSGVREFLEATAQDYPVRAGEENVPVDDADLVRGGVGYCSDPAYLRVHPTEDQP